MLKLKRIVIKIDKDIDKFMNNLVDNDFYKSMTMGSIIILFFTFLIFYTSITLLWCLIGFVSLISLFLIVPKSERNEIIEDISSKPINCLVILFMIPLGIFIFILIGLSMMAQNFKIKLSDPNYMRIQKIKKLL